ncbi:MAG: betaine--homocysteine S-methyltransferase [Actinomycetota bacterium]
MALIHDLLAERTNLLVDGAMGTELFARGLTAGDPPELWNVEQPDDITDVHKGYIKAGSDIVLTNSFGGTAYRLKLHSLDHRVHELNQAAAERARDAADASDRQVAVAGSMGPTGELIAPLGSMTADECRAAFAEQAAGLADGGADLLWVETMSSLEEAEAAINGARDVCDLPIAVTMSFDTAGRTMMGVTGLHAAERLDDLGLVAFGANCGNNIAETERAVEELRNAAPDAVIIVKANAGIPEFKDDRLVYNGTPEVMGAHLQRMKDLGIEIIGGCCGTSTPHVHFMRDVLDGSISAPDIPAPGPSRREAPAAGGERQRRRRRRG